MKYTRPCLLNYNLVKDYKALFPRLQSKRKDKALSTNQNLDSGARLQNGKVLGTHSAKTEFGLLDSKWPLYTLLKDAWHYNDILKSLNSI